MATNITFHSPFIPNISTFDNEDSYPDITFIIPGLDKPLKLHRMCMGIASRTIDDLFKKSKTVNTSVSTPQHKHCHGHIKESKQVQHIPMLL